MILRHWRSLARCQLLGGYRLHHIDPNKFVHRLLFDIRHDGVTVSGHTKRPLQRPALIIYKLHMEPDLRLLGQRPRARLQFFEHF
jgi:hypothetical protein